MLKTFFNLSTVVSVIMIQIGFLSAWPAPAGNFNLALCLVIFMAVILGSRAALWYALGLGAGLEIFSLYPYGFADMGKYGRQISVGNIRSGLNARFSVCRPGSEACRTCVKDYYRLPGMRDGAANYTYRTQAVSKFFYSMMHGNERPAFRSYIKKLIKIFG